SVPAGVPTRSVGTRNSAKIQSDTPVPRSPCQKQRVGVISAPSHRASPMGDSAHGRVEVFMGRIQLAYVSLPRRNGCVLGACVLALLLGCHSARFSLLSRDGSDDKGDPYRPLATVPGAPGKYNFRLAPYVFLSDFEVNRELPVFQELVSLRDQVYRELQLPP